MGDQLSWFAQKWGVSWDSGFSVLKSQQSQIDYHAVHQHLYGDVGPQSPKEVLFIPQMAHLGHSERHSQFSWRLQIIFYLSRSQILKNLLYVNIVIHSAKDLPK